MPRSESPLRRELKKRGIRYIWLAERLGVRKWTFSRIEGGKVSAPQGFYERAAEILNVPVDSIRREEAA